GGIGATDATTDSDAVDSPAAAAIAVIRSAAPAELNILTRSGSGKVDDRREETGRGSAPGPPSSQGIAEVSADRVRVAVADKDSSRSQDIRESARPNFNFEHTAIVALVRIVRLKIIAIGKRQLQGSVGERKHRRDQIAEAHVQRVGNKSAIRRSAVRRGLCHPGRLST